MRRRARLRRHLAAAAAAAAILAGGAAGTAAETAAPGWHLDPGYGTGGIARPEAAGVRSLAGDSGEEAVDGAGRVVFSVSGSGGFRLTARGRVDGSFGDRGLTPFIGELPVGDGA